ncbi:MAG: glycosyltransferase family 2 protein, partial [Actinomycetota bacterium]
MSITDTQRPDAVPGVLAVIVARDGVASLRDCLRGLAAQTYPRLGVVAVHAGRAGSREILERALGPQRVFEDTTDTGVAGALRLVASIPAAEVTDFFLVVHDDTALEADAVARLVDAARTIDGVGVVGPKIVDWDDPRVLRDIGASSDGFGHRYVALQDGERDQGQYDRVLEVLAVPSAAMLLTRDAWLRATPFDERLEGHHDDLDFCWRARLAGFRVVMTPLAQARHRGVPGRGERIERNPRSSRYYAERTALAMLLKDPGALRLVPTLLLYLVYAASRLASFALTRRFEDAFEVAGALAWNAGHLPGTIARRRQAQASRKVKDEAVVRFLTSPFHIPRWFERAEELLEGDLDEAGDETPTAESRPRRPLRERALSAAVGHPVLSSGVLAFLTLWIGFRKVRDAAVLTGGALAAFPRGSGSFFTEFSAPVRTTLLGGGDAPSPALAALGSASWFALGHGPRAQKWLLMVLLPSAAVLLYRALRRRPRGAGAGRGGGGSVGGSGP